MAIDGLTLTNVGVTREILPGEIQFQAKQASDMQVTIKKIDETEKQQLDPNGNRNKGNQQKRQEENDQQKAISNLFTEIAEPVKSDVQYNQKALELTENKVEYKVMYNSREEIVEIVHIKTAEVKETLTLEELKSFVMRVKNPLGIIVDRKI
ncbi:MAG: hypothetical protein WCF95_02335 [bacterium]